MSWYVIHVITGSEKKTRDIINMGNVAKAIVPQREMLERKRGSWRKVYRTLFPGYVFIDVQMSEQVYYAVRKVPGVIRILGNTNGSLSPVPEHEMQRILLFLQHGELMHISDVLLEGDKVIAASGPLVGMEGNIIKIDRRKGRAKISFPLYGEKKLIELSINIVKKSK